ncbi:MFS general substrate transporter [Thozetella sp. PMI_491]|nr:MFS general substrate transporter [Thozetella sp. PMI_491]
MGGEIQDPRPAIGNPDQQAGNGAVSESQLSYPEGGIAAWAVVFASFCIQVSVFGLMNSAAVFESYLLEHQLERYTASDVSWIFSSYLFFLYILGILVGPVFDRHGPRLLVFSGSVFMVLAPFLLSVSAEYYHFYLSFAAVMGIGGTLLFTPAVAAIGHFFMARRGLATGLAATGGSIGGVIFPFLLQATIPRVGFAWSMRIVGFILLALAVPANVLLRTRLPPATSLTSIWPDLTILRDPKLALVAAGIFFMEYGVLIPLTYVVLYAAEHGQDAGPSYLLPALLNAASIVGRAVPGVIADRFGGFNMIITTVGLCAASVLGLWLPARDSNAMLVVFSVAIGFASGGNVSLLPVCIGELCDSRNYGRFLSSTMVVAGLGTLTGIPIGGTLLRVTAGDERWTALILFSGLSYVAALACYTGARVLAVGWNPKIRF